MFKGLDVYKRQRMDRSQTVSLSPLSKSRGNRQVLDGRDVVVGFDPVSYTHLDVYKRQPWSGPPP